MQLKLEDIAVEGYHRVVKVTDEASGLIGIISIHSKRLGSSLGGIRIYPYATFDEALTDALRLSKGMTYKSAMIDRGFGGGKSVIIADPKKDKTPELLHAFATAIESLNGDYIGAEDSGCSPADLKVMREVTSYLVGLDHEKSSGNPSYYTAWGTFRGIQATLKSRFGSDDVKGKTVAIQGVGSVGAILADFLFWHGAHLILSDVDAERAQKLARKYGAEAVPADEILSVECDVLAPCALGGILNETSIPKLKCAIVAGASNNQLLTPEDGVSLSQRGILYAPDYVINAGGLVNVGNELEAAGYNPKRALEGVDKIYDRLISIFNIAEKNGTSTEVAAQSLAEYRLQYEIGKREEELCFHH